MSSASSSAFTSEAVRKSAFGRTSLFLTENSDVLVRTIRTASSAMQRHDGSVYHNLNTTAGRVKDIHCWHCCESLSEVAEPCCVPKAYDPQECTFHVYGHFCTLSCAKAYILEQASFDHGHQINVFSRMAREVYNVHDVVQAPPRVTLQKFGGPYDIREFHKKPFLSKLIEPPFVSYCMLAEERPNESLVSDTLGERFDEERPHTVDDDEFAEPPPSAMYDDYVQQQQEQQPPEEAPVASSAASTSRKRRQKTVPPPPPNAPQVSGLQKFMKK